MTTEKKNMVAAFKAHVDHWLPKLGSFDPAIPVSKEQADWFGSLTTEQRATVSGYVRRQAAEYGLSEPRLVVMS